MTSALVYELAWSCSHCGRSGVVRLPLDVTSPAERYAAAVEAHGGDGLCLYLPYVCFPSQ